jgi:hypothetical protein
MKAAGSMLSAPNQGAPNPAVLAQIPATVKAHNLSGPITDEAFVSLRDTFDAFGAVAPVNQQITSRLIEVFAMRVNAYKSGLPPDPSLDWRPAAKLLTVTGMWKLLNPAQQQQVMNLIADLLSAIAQAVPAKDLPQESYDQLKLVSTKTAEAIYLLASGALANAPLYTGAQALSKWPNGIKREEVPALITPVVDGVRKAFPAPGAGTTAGPAAVKP